MSWPQKVRDMAAERSELLCEGCGRSGPLELHHRQYRSRGGADVIENAIALCGRGNHTGCHGDAHKGRGGERVGWSVRSGHNPLLVPVFSRHDATWWRFDALGGKEPIHPIDAVEYMRLIGAITDGMVA